LLYLSRLDHQVKLRGHRIELGEIESALVAHEGVSSAVVLLREDRPGDQRLVAYIVGTEDASPSPEELRSHLGESLPPYMLPAHFLRLPSLPLTPNLKVDRKALPAPEGDRQLGATYVAPRGAAEERLAMIWGEILGAEQVGAEDNFFALGGHSLLATQVVSRLREELGVELPLRALFEAPTLAQLARRVEKAGAAEGSLSLAPPLVAGERPEQLPLSFAQERLWFLDQMEPGNPFYNLPSAVHLRGALDETCLERALSALVARHESLRSRFSASFDGVAAVQEIVPEVKFHLIREDLSGVSAARAEADLAALIAEEGRRPFDLSQAPLLRATLVRLGDADHALLLTVHHIVSDAWSSGLLVRDLAALYAAEASGGDAGLAELAVK
jgi:acyl carrier protein